MTVSPGELARRLSEADRLVVLLRQATLEMQAVRQHLLAERRRELERSDRDRTPHR